MMTITCPEDNREEKLYIADILCNEFLGLRYDLKFSSEVSDYHILLENGNEIILQDHFFSRFRGDLEYLNSENLPEKVVYANNLFLSEDDIPILYGTQDLEIVKEPSGSTRIDCGIDIFASCFFMLSRWEEYVSNQKDTLGRFSSKDSIAFRYGFIERPIVNEYTEFLWNLLKHAGIEEKRSEHQFSTFITHDVDFILRWYHPGHLFRALASAIIKKRSLKIFMNDLKDFCLSKMGKKNDPFDTFDYLMTVSEEHGMKSHFFFMSVDSWSQWHHYRLSHPFVTKLLEKIESRGHFVGFHPGIDSCNNKEKWKSEAERLSAATSGKIEFGRQHCLQLEVPVTWQIWNDFGMTWDSTLSYDDKPGFRAGCCYTFSVFNFLTRKKLTLKEKPLIIMDTALVLKAEEKQYLKLEELSKRLIDTVRKYNGDFVFLWHNSSFNLPEWAPFRNLYISIIKYLKEVS